MVVNTNSFTIEGGGSSSDNNIRQPKPIIMTPDVQKEFKDEVQVEDDTDDDLFSIIVSSNIDSDLTSSRPI